jgi:copper homeostasis protein (lipoprotein)
MNRYGNRIVVIFLITYFLLSCSASLQEDGKKYRGYFSYLADAALFSECSTNIKYPVAMEGDYIELERAYMELDKRPGEGIIVELIGETELRTNMEGTGEREFLIVKKFIDIFPGEKCK